MTGGAWSGVLFDADGRDGGWRLWKRLIENGDVDESVHIRCRSNKEWSRWEGAREQADRAIDVEEGRDYSSLPSEGRRTKEGVVIQVPGGYTVIIYMYFCGFYLELFFRPLVCCIRVYPKLHQHINLLSPSTTSSTVILKFTNIHTKNAS